MYENNTLKHCDFIYICVKCIIKYNTSRIRYIYLLKYELIWKYNQRILYKYIYFKSLLLKKKSIKYIALIVFNVDEEVFNIVCLAYIYSSVFRYPILVSDWKRFTYVEWHLMRGLHIRRVSFVLVRSF